VSLQDVTGFSLGLEVDGGRMTPIIPRNSPIPVKATRLFTTFHDDQEFVTVNVLQGESEYAAYNHSLVKFDLAPIPPAPKGTPDIEVEFVVDDDGIVSVTAADKRTGKAQGVRITDSNILTLRETERLARHVDQLMDVERDRRDLAQLKNHARYLVTRMNAFMVDRGGKLDDETVAQLSHAIGELERVAGFDNPTLLEAARRVIEREQTSFMAQVKATRTPFEVKLLVERE
jgi:molecular chaperone DnaK